MPRNTDNRRKQNECICIYRHKDIFICLLLEWCIQKKMKRKRTPLWAQFSGVVCPSLMGKMSIFSAASVYFVYFFVILLMEQTYKGIYISFVANTFILSGWFCCNLFCSNCTQRQSHHCRFLESGRIGRSPKFARKKFSGHLFRPDTFFTPVA